MTDELKQKVEALLFAAGRKISLEDIAKLCKTRDMEAIKKSLHELKIDFDERQSSLMIVEEGGAWKLVVREKFLSTVKQLVPETEMPKTVMETLAVIAW